MNDLSADTFFELGEFAYPELFLETAFVWDALKMLPSFVQKHSSLGNLQGQISAHAYLINPEQISIGRHTVVEPGAYIEGPCIIGEHCHIRQGAYIRGNVITGNDCVIGHGTEVKNSIFLNDAKAAHFNYVGDSILGNHTNLGAGTKLANLRLDRKEIAILWNGERVATFLKKFGAIVGDYAQTGCNTVANPGTLMLPKTLSLPCQAIQGVIT